MSLSTDCGRATYLVLTEHLVLWERQIETGFASGHWKWLLFVPMRTHSFIQQLNILIAWFGFYVIGLFGGESSHAEVGERVRDLSSYEKLYQTSPEFFGLMQEQYAASMDAVVAGFEVFEGEDPAFSKYANEQRDFAREAFILATEEVERIIELIDEEERFYYFEFELRSYRDKGFLVVREGEIVYRNPIEHSFFKVNGRDEEKPSFEVFRIDKLEGHKKSDP